MATRLITTVGGAYSNSYVTQKEADTFAVNFPWYNSITDQNGNTIKGWSDFTELEQRQALIQATFALQGIPWKGARCDPASDAGLPALDWDQYWLVAGDRIPDGIFGYFDDGGLQEGVGQGDEVLKWGIDGADFLKDVTAFRRKTFETNLKYWDKDGVELPPDRSEVISSSGSSGDQTKDIIYYWDTPVNISYITGSFNDAFDPSKSGRWLWGVYVNGDPLFNFPGTTADQAQRLAWPRSGVTCEGETADCTFIPQTIKNTQILVAYNFLIKPYLVPGTPSLPPQAPAGTYTSKQKLGDLEVQYRQYEGFDPTADNCTDCSDPYLYKVFDWLSSFLGCWADVQSGDSRMVRLYRN